MWGVRPSARRRNDIGAVPDEPLDHRHVPTSRGHVQWRFAVGAPGEVGVRAMIEQPVRPCGIVGPRHHVNERRHAARNAVHVNTESMQQLERGEIAAATRDVRR